MDKINVLKKAIYTYGVNLQLQMAIEEMSELTKEICKHMRGRDNRDHISEEMADVEIMLAQMRIIFENEDDIESYKEQKLKRLDARIESGNNARR